jgi:hypothetical protein
MLRVAFIAFAFSATIASAAPPYVRVTNYNPIQPAPFNATAQGVAEHMARNGRIGHFGGNRGPEGVGYGRSPEEAIRNCCYSSSGMAVIDRGIALGIDGRYYACQRYR